MFLKLILEFYDYLKALLGIKSKQKLDPAIIRTQVEEEVLLNNKNYEEYNEYTPLELVAKNPYSRQQANSLHFIKQDKSHNIQNHTIYQNHITNL